MRLYGVLLLLGLGFVAACGRVPTTGSALIPGQPSHAELLTAHPMPRTSNIHVVALGTAAGNSRHLVQIRDREEPHVHRRHDLVVFLLRGHGTLHRDGGDLEMGPGSIAAVDRGTPHWFENRGSEPAAAYVVFSPPFDGADVDPIP